MKRPVFYILVISIISLSALLFQCQLPETPDLTAPVATIIYPVSGQAVSGTVKIQIGAADDTELDHVNLYTDGEIRIRMTEGPFEYLWDTSPIADNQNHSISVAAFDAAGNTTFSPIVSVRVVSGPFADTLAPVINLVYPVTGTIVSDTINVVPQIVDDGPIAKVDYFVDGRLKFTSEQTPFIFDWDVTNLINGSSHTLFARAFDANLNNSYSGVITVTIESNNIIDNTPPTITINYPTAGITVSDTVDILASASDNIAIDRLELFVDGNLVTTLSQSPWIFPWDVTGYIDGTSHSIYINAYDTNQNQTTSAIVTVTVQTPNIDDQIPPTVFLSSPAAGAIIEGTTTVVAEASDNISVTRVEFYIDGNLVGTDNSVPYEYVWDTSGLEPASIHTIFTKAFDGAGNFGQSVLQTVTIASPQIDLTPPTVTILYPPAGATFTDGDTVAITADVQDNEGVQNVEFYIDGDLLFTDTSAPYRYDWDTTGYGNGQSHSIYVKAFDLSGNIGAQLITVIINP